MRKHILILAVLISVGISAEGQFSLGVKAGVNYSTIDANNLNNSSVAGYQVGAFARLGGNVYLQPELYLSSTGGQFQSSNDTYTGTVKFTYLNVPVLLGARFGTNSVNFRVMAGPVFTSILNTNESLSQNFSTAYTDFKNYKSATIDGQAGVGLDFGPLTADLRYQAGLTHVNDIHAQRQNLWALSVGFKIL
jgi:hypothetical protein